MKNKGNYGYLGGALIISVGMLISKLLGMVYRLPLAGALGSMGLGIYHTVFPVYALFVAIGGGAVSVALSRTVSKRVGFGYFGSDKKEFNSAFLFSFIFCFSGSVFMFVFADRLSGLQGAPLAALSYKCLAPALLFSGINSCIRGYFQGKMDMLPTAFSEICSQAIKPCVGLALCRLLSDCALKTAAAVFSVTVGEFASLVLLTGRFLADGKRERSFKIGLLEKGGARDFYSVLLPAVFTGTILPLSNAADSFIVINLLKKYTEHSVGLYGMFSGGVLTVLSIPAALSYGLAVAILPSVSSLNAKGRKSSAEKGVYMSLTLTLFTSLPIALFIYAFSGDINIFLFGRKGFSDLNTITALMKTAVPYAVFLPLLQTANSVLYGMGKEYAPVLSMASGVAVKTVAELFLLAKPNIGIFGYSLSLNLCYIVAVFVDLLYIIRDARFFVFALKCILSSSLSVYTGYLVAGMFGVILGFTVAVIAYFACMTLLRCYKEEELGFILRKKSVKEKGLEKVKPYDRKN